MCASRCADLICVRARAHNKCVRAQTDSCTPHPSFWLWQSVSVVCMFSAHFESSCPGISRRPYGSNEPVQSINLMRTHHHVPHTPSQQNTNHPRVCFFHVRRRWWCGVCTTSNDDDTCVCVYEMCLCVPHTTRYMFGEMTKTYYIRNNGHSET